MIIVGACLIWRASVILQRFLHQEKLEISLAGMVEELEAAARSGIASIEAERRKAEQLLADLMQQAGMEKKAAVPVGVSQNTEQDSSDAAASCPPGSQVESGVSSRVEVAEQSSPADQTSAASTPSHRRYEEVWRLQDAGVAPGDIARQLGMGRGEVELIQELRNYRKRDNGEVSEKS